MQRWLPRKFSNVATLPFVVERWNSRGAYWEMDVPAFLCVLGASISPDVNQDSWGGGIGIVLRLRP
jgi:hypothetical protein